MKVKVLYNKRRLISQAICLARQLLALFLAPGHHPQPFMKASFLLPVLPLALLLSGCAPRITLNTSPAAVPRSTSEPPRTPRRRQAGATMRSGNGFATEKSTAPRPTGRGIPSAQNSGSSTPARCFRSTTTAARSSARTPSTSYKTSRLRMRDWGVRYVDICILEWGSPQKSLEVLKPRACKHRVRVMIDSLNSSG